MLVRHLVLPAENAGTEKVLRFLAEDVSPNTVVNVMGQYRPCYRANEHPPLDRPVTAKEVTNGKRIARRLGLNVVD